MVTATKMDKGKARSAIICRKSFKARNGQQYGNESNRKPVMSQGASWAGTDLHLHLPHYPEIGIFFLTSFT